MTPPRPHPLIHAVLAGDEPAFRTELAKGALNEADHDGRTALHHAVLSARQEMLKLLIQSGAELSTPDKQGWTPLHYAAQEQNLIAVADLLAAGALVDATDSFGNTPLWRAVFASRGKGEVIRKLLAAGADRDRKNKKGKSPVDLAKTIANYDVAQFFS
jgi:ankyrin repeat protein